MATSNHRGYLSPGADFNESEILPAIQGPDQLLTGLVGVASRGPLGNVIVYNTAQLETLYGGFDDVNYLMIITAREILKHANRVIINRVVSGSAKLGEVSSDWAKFSTKYLTEEFNGATIELKYNTEDKIISYRLLSSTGEILETSVGYSLDPDSQAFIGKVFNNRSKYLVLDLTDDIPTKDVGFEDITLTIEGGNSGTDVVAADIVGSEGTGISGFMSPDTVDISTLAVPGWSHDADVIAALEKLTRYRGDVQVIIDPPNNLSVEEVISWSNGTGILSKELDNEWFATYYPWVKYRIKDKVVEVPPSVLVVAQWVKSDSIHNCWIAPAGYGNAANSTASKGRGYLDLAVDTVVELSKVDRDNLYGNYNVINPIAKFVGKGVVLFGNKTTRRTKFEEAESAFCSLNVRRLANYIRKFVIELSLTELFNPNDPFTWNSWRLKIDKRLQAIKSGRGLVAYKVIMDSSTVTEEDKRAGRMPGLIYVKPTRAAEYIPIAFVVTEDSVYFDDDESLEVGL